MKKINLDQFVQEANLTQPTSEAINAINGGCICSVDYTCSRGYFVSYDYTKGSCGYKMIHKPNIAAAARIKGIGVYKAEEVYVNSTTTTVVTKLY